MWHVCWGEAWNPRKGCWDLALGLLSGSRERILSHGLALDTLRDSGREITRAPGPAWHTIKAQEGKGEAGWPRGSGAPRVRGEQAHPMSIPRQHLLSIMRSCMKDPGKRWAQRSGQEAGMALSSEEASRKRSGWSSEPSHSSASPTTTTPHREASRGLTHPENSGT